MPIFNCCSLFQVALPAALVLLSTSAMAQIAVAGQTGATEAGLPTRLHYQSAFSGYQPDADPSLQSWREANERVGRIGGWRAYAREAATAQPAQGTPAVDPHAGHHGATQP